MDPADCIMVAYGGHSPPRTRPGKAAAFRPQGPNRILKPAQAAGDGLHRSLCFAGRGPACIVKRKVLTTFPSVSTPANLDDERLSAGRQLGASVLPGAL